MAKDDRQAMRLFTMLKHQHLAIMCAKSVCCAHLREAGLLPFPAMAMSGRTQI